MLAWLAVTTHRTVRTFTAETSRIDEATRQIAAQHPEAVDVDHARIREFSATLQALQTMGQQLTDSLQRQWQLEQQRTEQVAALAHDLKTPLTIIQGNAELLAESADTTAPELDAILRAGDRAQQYLAALRSVGTVPAARQHTDSHAFVAALADTANALCRPAKLHFVLQEQWQGQFLCAAPELSRALENMLDNAVRYTPAGGTVTLTISKADGDAGLYRHRYRPRLHARSPAQGRAVPLHRRRPPLATATRGWGCISPAASPRPTLASWCLPTPAPGRRCSFACPCNKR